MKLGPNEKIEKIIVIFASMFSSISSTNSRYRYDVGPMKEWEIVRGYEAVIRVAGSNFDVPTRISVEDDVQ
jgi:hypothetical protein